LHSLESLPFLQILLSVYFSIMFIAYLLKIRPFKSRILFLQCFISEVGTCIIFLLLPIFMYMEGNAYKYSGYLGLLVLALCIIANWVLLIARYIEIIKQMR